MNQPNRKPRKKPNPNNRKRTETRRIRKNINLDEGNITLLSLFFMSVFYFYLRVYATSRIGLNGAAYLFSSLDFILLFVLLVPFGIKQIMTRHIRRKLEMQEYTNTKRLLYGGFLVSIIYSVIIIFLLYILRNVISTEVLVNKSSLLCFLFLLPSILFISISSIAKSFVEACNNVTNIFLIEVSEKLLMIIGVIIFCNIFSDYGIKVSKVLISPEYQYAFGAAGSALGISVGLLISCIFNMILYSIGVKDLNVRDERQDTDDIYDILDWIRSDLFKIVAPFFFIALFLVFSQAYYFRTMEDAGNNDLMTYQWGAYSGVLFSLIIIPCIWIMKKTTNKKSSIASLMRPDNKALLLDTIYETIYDSYIYLFPAFTFAMAAAISFVRGVVMIDSDNAVRICIYGSVLVLTIPFALALNNILQAIKQHTMLIFNVIIALVLGVASLILFQSIIKLAMLGIILASFIASVILIFFNIKSLKQKLKIRINIADLIVPTILSIVAAVVIFLLGLVLNLFLPATITLIIQLIVYAIILFILYSKFQIVNEYSLQNTFLGMFFISIGKNMRLF